MQSDATSEGLMIVPQARESLSAMPESIYHQRGFCARKRMMFTKLALIGLFAASLKWSQSNTAGWMVVAGGMLVISGVAIRIWAAGCLRKQQALAVSGPYAFLRHPLYLGTGLAMCGQSLMSCLAIAPLVIMMLWFCLYWPVIREEETYLAGRYGGAFATYSSMVPALLPRIYAGRSNEKAIGPENRFSWEQVWRNREYEGALVNTAFAIAYIWLNCF